MEKIKNNWLLIGALMFFLTSAGFTTISNEQNNNTSVEGCYVCSALGCWQTEGSIPGSDICVPIDVYDCMLMGTICFAEPEEN